MRNVELLRESIRCYYANKRLLRAVRSLPAGGQCDLSAPGFLKKRFAGGGAVGAAIALAVSACAAGPNFKPPSAPEVRSYTRSDLSLETESTDVVSGGSQRLLIGRDLPGEWWKLFRSNKLDELIDEAMRNYPDIVAQQAALRAARDNVRAEQGVFFPQVQGTGNSTREQASGAAVGPGFPSFISNIFQATVNVSYTFDIFGGERRTVEALQAQAAAQGFQLEASYLTLISNVTTTTIEVASVRDQIKATHEIIALEITQLGLIERQFNVGSRTRADVLQQQSNLATVRATLPALQQQLAVASHQLAVLTGRFPSQAQPAELALSDLTLPQDLPVSVPSSLVAQRPDIRSQEMLMHKASAEVGVATANLLPQLTLSGSYGGESLRFSSLLSPSSAVWNFAAGVTQPIFQGGTLRAKRRAAIDTFEQVGAEYRLVVLQAFQNVADSLTALGNDAEALKAENEAVTAATASLDLVRRQYDSGAANYVSLLASEQAYQQARISYVRALASRFTDTVTLFQALGGGWWNRHDMQAIPAVSSDRRALDSGR